IRAVALDPEDDGWAQLIFAHELVEIPGIERHSGAGHRLFGAQFRHMFRSYDVLRQRGTGQQSKQHEAKRFTHRTPPAWPMLRDGVTVATTANIKSPSIRAGARTGPRRT